LFSWNQKKSINKPSKNAIMKTSKKINDSGKFTLLVMSVLVVALIAFSSCGKANDPNAPNTEVPAPPPPPVPVNPDSVYVQVDELPVFPGGDTTLLKYIADNVVYPAGARINKIQGKVVVRLIVEKDCSVSNVEIVKGVNPLLDAEAIRVVKTLPKFVSPAKKDGVAVGVHYMIPISFALK
jgi:protein TonB